MGDHNLVSHTLLRVFITIIIMSSKTIILLFGILAFVAIAAAMSDDYDDTEVDEASIERVAREADPGRQKKRAGKKGKKLKKKNKKSLKKKGQKKRMNKNKDRKRIKGNRKVAKKEDDKSTCFGCRTVSANCLTQAISLMKYWKDIVTNFEKQSKRIASQSKTGGRKADKKGVFSSIALNLVDIGGGDKSSLSCGGSTSNSGAKQLKNLTDTLFACEMNINASCNSANFDNIYNQTLLDECATVVNDFKKMAGDCIKKTSDTTGTEACTCWEAAELMTLGEKIKADCKLPEEARTVTSQLNKCKEAFGMCRKFEDDANDALASCSQTSSGLTGKAATLKANSDALTAAKTKMSSLAGSRFKGRSVRAVETTCAEVISKAKELSSLATESPSSSTIATLAAEISGVSSAVTCSTTEIADLTTQITAISEAIETVDDALEAALDLLETLTGSTPESSALTTAASSATAASSGRRQRLVRDILKNMI